MPQINFKTFPKKTADIKAAPMVSTKSPEYATMRYRRYSIENRAKAELCAITGRALTMNTAILDHIYPVNEGGSFWDVRNHQILHKLTHGQKTAKERGGCKTPFVLNTDGEKIPANRVEATTILIGTYTT